MPFNENRKSVVRWFEEFLFYSLHADEKHSKMINATQSAQCGCDAKPGLLHLESISSATDLHVRQRLLKYTWRAGARNRYADVTRAIAKPSYPLLPTVCIAVALIRGSFRNASKNRLMPLMFAFLLCASIIAPLRTTLSAIISVPAGDNRTEARGNRRNLLHLHQ